MAITSISADRIAAGFDQPVFAAAPPGDADRLFVVERAGRVKALDMSAGTTSVFLDISGDVTTIGEGGLLGLAFDPNYAVNGYCYVYLTNTEDDTEIRRYRVSFTDSNQADASSGTLVVAIDQPDSHTNHKGGWIGFGPRDGYLYVGLGDGGVNANAQDASSLLGKILRLDVAADAYPADAARNYAIPSDNPFVATAGVLPEIWALGLRNPFRAGFDRLSGELYIGDVGEDSFEEIDLGRAGGNYQWNVLEGPKPFNAGPLGPGISTAPIYSYDHAIGETVIGGYVYRGPDAGLQGLYFFADWISGRIFTLEKRNSAWVATDRTDQVITNSGAIGRPVSFAEDAAGNLYIIDFDGELFRLGSGSARADDYAADTSTTGQVAIGGSASGNLEIAGDHDWFRIQLTAGHDYIISQLGVLGGSGNTLQRPDVRLRDNAGMEVAHDSSGAGNSEFGVHVNTGGTFFIDAGAGDPSFPTGTYTVAIRDVGSGAMRFGPLAASMTSGFTPNIGGWISQDDYPRALFDMDGDGLCDIVGFAEAGVYAALSSPGSGGEPGFADSFPISAFFGASQNSGGWTTQNTYPRQVGDVNHDHLGDIVGFASDGMYVSICNFNFVYDNPVKVLDTFGQSPAAGGWISQDRYPRQLADINGDGAADIVGFGEAGVYVALAIPDPALADLRFAAPAFASPVLALANFAAAPEAGGFVSQNNYPRIVADVNGDGKADIVGFATEGVIVSLAAGEGRFDAPFLALNGLGTALATGGWTDQGHYPRQVADVNADGRADIVGFGETAVFVALANPDGTFANPTADIAQFALSPSSGNWSGFDPYPRLLGDINGDHRADIIGFGGSTTFLAQSHDYSIV
jgi:glucose/arabinose dehydrogenase